MRNIFDACYERTTKCLRPKYGALISHTHRHQNLIPATVEGALIPMLLFYHYSNTLFNPLVWKKNSLRLGVFAQFDISRRIVKQKVSFSQNDSFSMNNNMKQFVYIRNVSTHHHRSKTTKNNAFVTQRYGHHFANCIRVSYIMPIGLHICVFQSHTYN